MVTAPQQEHLKYPGSRHIELAYRINAYIVSVMQLRRASF